MALKEKSLSQAYVSPNAKELAAKFKVVISLVFNRILAVHVYTRIEKELRVPAVGSAYPELYPCPEKHVSYLEFRENAYRGIVL